MAENCGKLSNGDPEFNGVALPDSAGGFCSPAAAACGELPDVVGGSGAGAWAIMQPVNSMTVNHRTIPSPLNEFPFEEYKKKATP